MPLVLLALHGALRVALAHLGDGVALPRAEGDFGELRLVAGAEQLMVGDGHAHQEPQAALGDVYAVQGYDAGQMVAVGLAATKGDASAPTSS